jgi:lipopolysaccharide export LptBFGC system permease protein LptF
MAIVKDVLLGIAVFASTIVVIWVLKGIQEIVTQRQSGLGVVREWTVPFFVAGVCFIALSVFLFQWRIR